MSTCINPLYKTYINPLLPPPNLYSLYAFCPSIVTVPSVYPRQGSPYANPILNPPSAFPPLYPNGYNGYNKCDGCNASTNASTDVSNCCN